VVIGLFSIDLVERKRETGRRGLSVWRRGEKSKSRAVFWFVSWIGLVPFHFHSSLRPQTTRSQALAF
jgi:hypothetical protein